MIGFTVGQRWISNTESQLGLGIITQLQTRQVAVRFPAAEEERIYAIDQAPLSRIIYQVGDEIISIDEEKIIITQIEERQGLVFYSGIEQGTGITTYISEVKLSCFINLNTPQQRLFTGLLAKRSSFELRVDTLYHLHRLQQSATRGLIGTRTNHLPHQVYIAQEVARRHAPRVLLADEVGLGKTIEAGMILHHQLLTGRVNRVLIVVPESLTHQWLVEMLRRFNLAFTIVDANRYASDSDQENPATGAQDISANPFATESLILCSLDFLCTQPEAYDQALAADWDLVVVDEAHHLAWSEQEKSIEYQCIESLSSQSKGLLLLTATPEQAGIASHFARLRLLDPSRFYAFSAFKEEEEKYQQVNQWVQKLLAYPKQSTWHELDEALKHALQQYLAEYKHLTTQEMIKQLLDQHGTSRVLFRNTRAAMEGFPKRCRYAYPLPLPAIYQALGEQTHSLDWLPERHLPAELWLKQDPRVNWLIEKAQELGTQKILVICAHASTAQHLEKHLKLKAGIRSIAFHEQLTLIERDRAAAYFAEEEQGAQILICSEIGSEGRNFQFAHHLVLFDLPLNPDLIEQRIGRLDRIGQQHDIHIHVPYLKGTVQEKLYTWYEEGLNLFTQNCSAGYALYQEFAPQLHALLGQKSPTDDIHFQQLLQQTQTRLATINQILETGRDRLLELNSCDLPKAQELIKQIEAEENCVALQNYMGQIFQEYGVEHEYHSEASEILNPSDHMKISYFPGLKEDGTTVTYSRLKALHREDMAFLSWEHPMVRESMEMVLESELGNAALATITLSTIPPGTLFLEAFYTVNCMAPKKLQLERFLPLTPIRFFMEQSGKNLTPVVNYQKLNQLCHPVKRHLGYPIIKQVQSTIENLLAQTVVLAEEQLLVIKAQAQNDLRVNLGYELSRLQALREFNSTIRLDEINNLQQQIDESLEHIDRAGLVLQALRVVINKH